MPNYWGFLVLRGQRIKLHSINYVLSPYATHKLWVIQFQTCTIKARFWWLLLSILGQVLSQITDQITWLAFITYSMEVIGPSKRSLGGAFTHVIFSVGYMTTSLLGYLVPDWREFTLFIAGLNFISILTFPFFPESFR